MKRYLILISILFFENILAMEEKKFLKPEGSEGSRSNGKELRRTKSGGEIEKIQAERAKQQWIFNFNRESIDKMVSITAQTTQEEIQEILDKLKKLWDDKENRSVFVYFKYLLKGGDARSLQRSGDEEQKEMKVEEGKYEKYKKILFEAGLLSSDGGLERIVQLVGSAALQEHGKLLSLNELISKKIIQLKSKKEEIWFFKLPNEIESEITTGSEIRDVLSNLRDVWDDKENKPALEYFILFLKNKIPESLDPKDQEKFDKILIKGKLMERDNSVKKIVRLVVEVALSDPQKLLLFNELRYKKIIQPEAERMEEEEKVKEYESNGEFFVFHVSSVQIEEFKTTGKNIKKIDKKLSELKDQEKLSFNDMVEGNVILRNIPFVIKGNKEKLEKEILDYYKNNNRTAPKNVKYLLKVIINPIVENLEKHIKLLKGELAQENEDFKVRIGSLLDGILNSEKKLIEAEIFKVMLKEKGLMNQNGTIPYLVKYLWKILVKPGEKKLELISIADAFKEKRIYIKE